MGVTIDEFGRRQTNFLDPIAVIFARVSSTDGRQDTERQVKEMKKYADVKGFMIVRVFEEEISGATSPEDRPVLQECLQFCRNKKVNAIFISELSRLSRKMFDAFALLKQLADEKINVFCKEPNITLLDESGNVDPNTMLLIATSSYFAELERQFIQKRLQSGRASYKEKGGKFGRPEGSSKAKEKYDEEYREVIELLEKGVSIRTIAKLCHKSPSTVNHIKQMYNINTK